MQVGSTALEMWLFPSIEFGVERLAAMYHVRPPDFVKVRCLHLSERFCEVIISTLAPHQCRMS